MNMHASLLGIYQPGDGWLFRIGVGWKYLLLIIVTLPTFIVGTWWMTALALTVVLVLLRTAGVTFRRALNVGSMLWILLGGIAAFQLITLRPLLAFITTGNLLVAVLASRMLTLTTSTPDLLDALVRGLTPLRKLGVNVDQIALTVAIMVRSIPYLLGSFQTSRDAARARGRDGSLVSLLVPTLVDAVSYAQRTGDAVHARGLAERDSDVPPTSPAA